MQSGAGAGAGSGAGGGGGGGGVQTKAVQGSNYICGGAYSSAKRESDISLRSASTIFFLREARVGIYPRSASTIFILFSGT